MRLAKTICLLVIAGFGLSACATTGNNITSGISGFGQEDDEQGLWYRSDQKERVLLRSGFIEEDEELTEYVNAVLSKVVGSLEKKHQVKLRVHVIRDPYFNAFMLPNGAMFIHSGLIANLENEAQLATVIGHEAAHFFNRDGLKKHRSRVNKSAFFSFFQTAFGPGNYTKLGRLYRNLVINSTMAGYSRELERNADRTGFELMLKAGYDPYESKKAFEILAEATKKKKNMPYFFSSHPRIQERISNFEKLLTRMEKSRRKFKNFKGAEEFSANVTNVLITNARLSLKSNKFKDALRQAERYIGYAALEDERQAEARMVLAEAYQRQQKHVKAREVLSETIEEYPLFADAYRELGLIMYKKKGRREEARVLFQKYLELLPSANDAEYVKGYLDEG